MMLLSMDSQVWDRTHW